MGFGWDNTKWDNQKFPSSDMLNSLPIHQPVMLTRIDGHSCWVNHKAIQLSGMDVSQKPPDGGDIINNCILVDNAMIPVKLVIPKPDKNMVEKWIKLALDIIIPRGITNIHDAWQDPTTVKILQELSQNNELPIRVYGMLGSAYPKLLNQFFE